MQQIIHCVNVYDAGNREEQGRNQRAKKSWDEANQRFGSIGLYRQCFKSFYGRSSSDIGDNKEVPFVKDVIESGSALLRDSDDIIMLTNADSCLVQEAVELISERFSLGESVVWSSRRDVDKPMSTVLTQQQAMDRGLPHRGLDLWAFTWKWWLANRDLLPDTLISYEGWDVIPILMLGDSAMMKPPVAYHELHSPNWFRFRTISRGNMYNRSLVRRWLDANGKFAEACKTWKGVSGYRILPEHK